MSKDQIKKSGLSKEILSAAWAIALGAIAPMLDSTMVNISIDKLNKDFSTTLDTIQWSITGYVLALAIAVPVSGWLMNKFNGKKILIGAVIAFGVTSVFAGVSWNISSFILFRLLQGFSAGIITPLMSTLLVKTAGREHIGKVMAIVSTPMILGPILGPVIGGFIVQATSWHWIFFINVFIVLIAAPLMMKTLPDFEPFNKNSKLDIFGIINLSLMSAAMIYGITKAADHASFNNSETILWTGIGLALAVIYIVYNRIRKNQTVLPINLFAHKNFLASSVGLLLANIAVMGPMLILPLFFQNFRHFTAIEAALALIPQGVGMLITRPMIGKMIDRVGAKYVVMASLVLSLIGSIPLIFITDKTSMIWISIILFIRGTSFGGIMLPLTSDAYTGLGSKQLPEAGVGIHIIENLGSSFGTAVIATVVATVMQGLQPTIANGLKGYHAGFLVSTIVLAVIFIPSLFLTHKKAK
ncbi:MDR family MFS transporter [Bacillus subtilis]|uniref:MDR family MFS transporter n=1 Tax=Bacillus TaxID=1386 RepID=UPI0010A9C4D3|nr:MULTISPECIES: MDR family MFS transporter [Bacillus]TII15968.1 MFS transporter [Bacillus subtilis]MDN0189788.1 multidrug efflux MFS transporter [Bacillus sp. B.PNR1]MDN3034166.1 MDR family MFS transporter [Bacillus sp. B.PNR2]MDO7345994.1 MDR family MFS transporter [Bacillus stercoris]WGV94122.1 MDR family MFS transporter [Bacillus stercoris]